MLDTSGHTQSHWSTFSHASLYDDWDNQYHFAWCMSYLSSCSPVPHWQLSTTLTLLYFLVVFTMSGLTIWLSRELTMTQTSLFGQCVSLPVMVSKLASSLSIIFFVIFSFRLTLAQIPPDRENHHISPPGTRERVQHSFIHDCVRRISILVLFRPLLMASYETCVSAVSRRIYHTDPNCLMLNKFGN